MSPSERNLDKELPQLGTITSKFHSFFEAPPIFEVALIAKPAGVKSSYTSGGHSPVEVAAPFVATAGWLVSLLTSTCEVWAVWNGFGHTQPITCSSQQFKDLALCFFFFTLLPCLKMEASVTEIINVFVIAGSAGGKGNISY